MQPMRSKQAKKVTDQLREAIISAPVSRYQLCRQTGLDKALLSRFVHRKAGLAMESIDLLCAALGLELRPVRRPRAKKGR